MTDETHTLHIKNMVCHRCVLAVDHALQSLGLHPLSVELGIAVTAEELTPDIRQRVKEELEALEFELIDNRRMQTVQQMKDLIVTLVHHPTGRSLRTNLSDYLAHTIGKDYGTLSKLFEHRLPQRPVQEHHGAHTYPVQATEREATQAAG